MKADEHGSVGARLREDLRGVDIAELSNGWYERRVQWRLGGMGRLASDPGLIGRVRGAFGNALLAGASPEVVEARPCPWSPPCAAEALWRKQGRMTKGTDFPSPWLLAATPARGGDLVLELTVFGFAVEWLAAAAEALTAALPAVDWRGAQSTFVPRLRLLDRRLVAPPAIEPVVAPDWLSLRFATPVVVTNGSAADDPSPLMTTLPLRLAGLARWHGLELAQETIPPLRPLLAQAGWEWSDATEVRWMRGSRRQNRAIPMRGVLGQLDLAGDPGALAALHPLLALAERCGVGADVAFGCGRFELHAH